jgi:hypothetical protein
VNFDLRAQFARIDRTIAETGKLQKETHKFVPSRTNSRLKRRSCTATACWRPGKGFQAGSREGPASSPPCLHC